MDTAWWRKPRVVSVVVDNDSWVLPFAERLVARVSSAGDDARLVRTHADIASGGVAFFLGCTKIAKPETLARNHKNLIVHASDLPEGRGFSPMTWQILEGKDQIPVCLLEAALGVDSGPVVAKAWVSYEGHELNDELRAPLGDIHIALCERYLAAELPPEGEEQKGIVTTYARRRAEDSRLDPHKSLAVQFNLLRVVDNDRYPAFFELRGHLYTLRIEKQKIQEES
ncbi:UDP-glucuronic acid dehydrogenase [Hyphomicrobium sp.]|uniref:UDP-glucuronic acid dehydrogenase n=1 Tax=Hyphomicrobium sp. TaxID=82 RepID=UPI0025B9045A|nr:UDP-glucuronic acid dehydrogenase [Hyphomicrobium sp.]MCC7250952.1 UDP-glucuronic acid dehydrogenase [Hyphomicrobium sp.]